MKRCVLFATLALILVFALSASARTPRYKMAKGTYGVLEGAPVNTAKASRDTTYLLGGPSANDGKFSDGSGAPNWNGWTHEDTWFHDDQRWFVSTFNRPTGGGNYSCWCGMTFPNSCGPGYGNDWVEDLVFTYHVADPNASTVVNFSCIFNNNSETGWDYFKIQYNQAGTWTTLNQWSGLNTDITFSQAITFNRPDYVNGDLQIRLHADSDGNTSDQDCLLNTNGHTIVDNIVVAIQGGPTFSEDFEDQTIDDWVQVFFEGVGDFSKIWTSLGDIDPCHANATAQVAFIDDGIVVPGTGGTTCQSWCYGPSGYIVNNTGGLAGGDYYLNDVIVSPHMTWPAGADAASMGWDVYRHENMAATDAGVFYQWQVRSVDTGNAVDLDLTGWRSDNFVHFGGPSYLRTGVTLTSYLIANRTHIQVGLRCIELGWVWNVIGTDGTPAPYFDNVSVIAYPYAGPAMSGREIDVAQDNFPDRGVLDFANLANDFIRFDMARDISPAADLHNDPGDSIIFTISLPRAGSVLHDMPKMVVKMKANPLFDGVRVLPANFSQTGDIVDGWVYGDSTFSLGSPVPNVYHFDLPDSNFLFPGDVIHYYLQAQDQVGADIGTSTAPGNLAGFDNFDRPLAYSSPWTVRGLPTLFDTQGHQPPILFWNDFANNGGEQEWLYALNNLGYNAGIDYDEYYTNGPSSGVGDGLGGRATVQTIGGYDVLLYTCGPLATNTISNNDYDDDPSADLQLLDNWFNTGGKHGFFTGDDLVYSLTLAGSDGLAFVDNYFGVASVDINTHDVAQYINNQVAPTVRAKTGNAVFPDGMEWIAYGGCNTINTFDALTPNAGTLELAEWLTPSGGTYSNPHYSAATRKQDVGDAILFPYDLMFVYNAPGYVPSVPALPERATLLQDVLIAFGVLNAGEPIGVPDANVFSVANYPNPFNPQTTIKLNLPKAGDVSLKVFNVRGELVKTLVHGRLDAGERTFVWDGTNDQGGKVSSGVYFYEARANGEVKINKMALVK